ncbi:hypothetical protein HZP42_11360 [Elizabethkingia anophelis]|uniref:hypothetical protein n=1 Tax=Elizabethkingia anophelis TaxID=1117645 RepID=UPI0006694C1A|nr:hypothetical protein [Elizabethkingia anophelis]AQW92115.1 hypothetical protein BBD28_16355 [Elizabethkingia anophelis]KUY14600.1 hypothetical protein ATB94_07135 [Elizabethkingia anophelis]MCT3726756.1 hypothetical protein [Elizabethkingia anophelis]MCT4150266.1 hypothetical protein [Elizabethkingia anophelis]MCT4236984.1 hypothetical protein [Elizabethkingia anophelis]
MTIQLIDIVFQNDRYYLLFDDNNALEISTNTNEWYVFTDDEYLCNISECNVSEALKIPGKIILETKINLNKLENRFRKIKSVKITSDKINI